MRQADRARRSLLNVASCGAMLLSACAHDIAPTAPPQTLKDLPSWTATDGSSETSSTSATSATGTAPTWAQFFTDPELQDLLSRSLRNNRDLRVAALNVEWAAAQAAQREADLWPTVVMGLTGVRQSVAGGKLLSSGSAGVQISGFELDVFARLRGLSEAAAAQVLTSSENRRAVQIGLVAAVAAAVVALRIDDEMVQVAQQVEASRVDTQRLVQLRVRQGASSLLDLRTADAALDGARAALAQAQRQRWADLHALGILVGEPIPALKVPATGWLDRVGAVELTPGLPSEVLARRPDVRAAEESLKAAQANVQAARAALFPKIVLTGTTGTTSAELTNLFKAGTWGWSVAPQLLQTLWDSGRNQAALSGAKTAREIAVAQYDKAVQTAFREAADAIVAHTTWKVQMQSLVRQDQAEQDRLNLSRLKFQHGALSQLDLLEAQRAAWSTQVTRLQAQAQAAQTRIALFKALGGGWH